MKFLKSMLVVLPLLVQTTSYSQDLMSERIRKIAGKKRSVYFKKGIFHSGTNKTESVLKAIRHGFQPANGYERLVFDFKTPKPPKVYGYKSEGDKKIFIDLFNTSLASDHGVFGSTKYIDKIDFYPVGDETLSVEVALKGKHSIDVFYLEKPGRLVIDIKK
jgi:hypothetical protein